MDTPLTAAENLLAKGKLGPFFDLINKEKQARGSSDHFFILQESRWSRAHEAFEEGTLPKDQYDSDINRITKALLGKLNEYYDVDISNANSPVLNKLYKGFVNDNAPLFFKPEKVIADKIKSILWLNTGIERSKIVCRISIGPAYGTGTVINGRYLITCNHVIGHKEDAADARLQFNYVEGTIAANIHEYKLKQDGLFFTDTVLDFTICEIEEELQDHLSNTIPISLQKTNVKFVKDVQIIQHPDGEFMQIALIDSRLVKQEGHRIFYTSDTEGGSSGAAVFNEKWELIGIHTSASSKMNANAGTFVNFILEKLEAEKITL
ncbi:MAG: trypsin-like peptidase domain-containing protein [Chitinophagaceae bacterium]